MAGKISIAAAMVAGAVGGAGPAVWGADPAVNFAGSGSTFAGDCRGEDASLAGSNNTGDDPRRLPGLSDRRRRQPGAGRHGA